MKSIDHQQMKYKKEIGLAVLVIISLGASVNFLIFGFANIISFSDYRNYLLLPSLFVVFFISIYWSKKNKKFAKTLLVGLLIGAIATISLEAIRIPSIYVQWIPHDDMIALPGRLLLMPVDMKNFDSMMDQNDEMHDSESTHSQQTAGKTHQSDHMAKEDHSIVSTSELVAGGLYHFWNGATMAAVYTLIVGKGRWYFALIWGIIIHIGMMLAPWMLTMVGPFGINYGSGYTIFTASLLAHIAYGIVIGILAKKYIDEKGSLLVLFERK